MRCPDCGHELDNDYHQCDTCGAHYVLCRDCLELMHEDVGIELADENDEASGDYLCLSCFLGYDGDE